MTPDINWHDACERLSLGFVNAIDRHDAATVLAIFTEDGIFTRFGETSAGQAELAQWLASRPAQTIRHVCTNFLAGKTSETTATGVTYFTAYRAMGTHEPPVTIRGPLMMGEYHDDFRLTEDGWRIAKRRVEVVFQFEG